MKGGVQVHTVVVQREITNPKSETLPGAGLYVSALGAPPPMLAAACGHGQCGSQPAPGQSAAPPSADADAEWSKHP